MSLTADQARYIYNKVGQESIVNVETIKEEIDDDRLDEDNNNEKEENPYQNIILNEFDWESIITSQWNNRQYLATLLIMYS